MARGKGEGSVYKEASSGLWAGSIEVGRDANGKRKRKVVRAKTKREALDKLQAARNELTNGRPVRDQTRTLAAYIDWWQEKVLPGTVRDSTADGYRYMLRRYVVPRIGTVKLAKLGPADVLGLLRDLEADGYSVSTRQQVRAVLRRALSDAERYEMIGRNAAALVESPRKGRVDTSDAFTLDEAKQLLSAAKGDPLELVAQLALRLGLRRGEILGLKWEDIDLESRTLAVRRTLKRRSGVGLVLDSPKTEKGSRVLPLDASLCAALRKHRTGQAEDRLAAGPAWQGEGFVLMTPVGTPLDPRNLGRWWAALCETAGLEPRRFHATRHTAATLMRDNDVPLEVVSKMLGHASVAITGDIYAQPSAESLRSAAKTVEAIL